MADFTNQAIKFHSEALADNTLLVSKLSGSEQLSGLFRFELELVSSDPNVDLQKVLYQPAKVGLEQRLSGGQRTFRWFAGTLETFQVLEQGQSWTSYRAVLVPEIWKLTEFYRSRIFQGLTVDELVTEVLKRDLELQPSVDFEFKLTRSGEDGSENEDGLVARNKRAVYPEREYVVQYEESDYTLVARWLEHEGIFYFFENDGTVEKVVFADSVSAYKPVDVRSSTYPYRPQGRSQSTGSVSGDEAPSEEVLSIICTVARQPKKLALNDYNWRDPSETLNTSKDVYSDGNGLQNEYNDHYKTGAQGEALAEVRIEEWTCRAAIYEGVSTCRGFRPGRTFELSDHFRDDFNDEYVLTEVVHEADQTINLEASTVTGANYQNAFKAIPAKLAFRPERLTEWPSIKGAMNAQVDAADGSGDDYADVDSLGRYKLKIPFDQYTMEPGDPHAPDAGSASRYVRMAQPYAGDGAGMHFPLHKGTEVLLTHIDGDPDRPVIAAAVPNMENRSPVDERNSNQNTIQTVGGNSMVIDDSADLAGFMYVDAGGKFLEDWRQSHSGSPNGGVHGGGGGAPQAPRLEQPSATPPATPPAPQEGPPRPSHPALAGLADIAEGMAAKHAEQRAGAEPRPAPAPGPDDRVRHRPLPPAVLARLRLHGGWAGDNLGAISGPDMLDTYLQNDDTDFYTAGKAKLQAAPVPYDFNADFNSDLKYFDRLLRVWRGDFCFIWKGDKYTYADVSNDISFGTGGFGFHEEFGDTNDLSMHIGNATSMSIHLGTSNSASLSVGGGLSSSISIGNEVSSSITLGSDASTSLTLGLHTSMSVDIGAYISTSVSLTSSLSSSISIGPSTSTSITIATNTSTSITLAAETSTSITMAAKTSTDITMAASTSTEITMAAKAEASITMAAKASVDLTLAAEASMSLVLAAKTSMGITLAMQDTTDITLALKSATDVTLGVVSNTGVFVGGKITTDISAAIVMETLIAAAAGLKINITAGGCTEITIPQEEKITIKDGYICLTKGDTVLMKSETALMVKEGA